MSNIHTLLFTFLEGTYICQLDLDFEIKEKDQKALSLLADAWLEHLHTQKTTLAGQLEKPISIIEYFDDVIFSGEGKIEKCFERQIRDAILDKDLYYLCELDGLNNIWGVYFDIDLGEETEEIVDSIKGLGELYIVKTAQ